MSVYNAWLLQVVLGSLQALAFAWAAQQSNQETCLRRCIIQTPFFITDLFPSPNFW